MHSGSFEKNFGKSTVLQKGGKSMGPNVNSEKKCRINTLQARKSASISRCANKGLGERTDAFITRGDGKGTEDQAKHRRSSFSVATEVAATSLYASYGVGLGRGCLENNSLSGTSQDAHNTINKQPCNQKEVAANISDPEVLPGLTQGESLELGNIPSPIAIMSAAIEEARFAQSRSGTALPEIRPQPKSSIAPHHDLSGSRQGGSMPMHLNLFDSREAPEINETSVAATATAPTRNVTFAVTETARGARKQLLTSAKRSLTRRNPCDSLNDKKAIPYLGSLNKNLVQLLNDHNEHNKSVRERLGHMEAERVEERKVEKDRHEEVCRLLIVIRGLHDVGSSKQKEGKGRFALPLLEGCCAMLRYVYSLSGKGVVSAKFMYPTMKMQEDLIQFVVRTILEVAQDGGLGVGNKNNVSLGNETGVLQDVSMDSEERYWSSEVQAFLGSRIVTTNRISVIETTNKGEEQTKSSVKMRMLDQRRRFHDYVTTPVVNKWLQRCQKLDEFDTSLKTMKQDPKVFEAEAEIFEKDSRGSRRYMSSTIYGNSFHEACLTLKRMSADHTERALAQAMKAFQDPKKVRLLCEKVLEYENCNDAEIKELGRISELKDILLSHQLAFVHTKIHARLEWLSQCKISGGKSVSKPDRSHYALYLGYIMSIERLLQVQKNSDRDASGVRNVRMAYHILGVPVTTLAKSDVQVFRSQFYGESEDPSRNEDRRNEERNILMRRTQPSQVNNSGDVNHSLGIFHSPNQMEEDAETQPNVEDVVEHL